MAKCTARALQNNLESFDICFPHETAIFSCFKECLCVNESSSKKVE
jgi:hypothetical protein